VAQRGSDAYRHPYRDADCPPNTNFERPAEPIGIGIGIDVTKHVPIGIALGERVGIGIGVSKHVGIGIATGKRLALGSLPSGLAVGDLG
jgi:hypothetical protein